MGSQAAGPPISPGDQYAAVFELPHAENAMRAYLEGLKQTGTLRAEARLDLVKPGTRFVVLSIERDPRMLAFSNFTTEAEILHAVEWFYDRAAKTGRTGMRWDYCVTDAVLEQLRALEVELPKRYAGAPAIN